MIKISTGNSKTGPSFSLPEGITCPGKTELCADLCYVKTGRMNLPTSRTARSNQLSGVIELMKQGKLDKTLAGVITGASVRTIRIHDSGDFMSPEYVRAWIKACKQCSDVQFWAYTRSFTVKPILDELIKLAKLPNVAIWLSGDQENWLSLIATYKRYSKVFAGIAFMETKDDNELSVLLASTMAADKLVIFPVHGHFGRLSHIPNQNLPNCPAITKELKHDDPIPACLRCLKCLPIKTKAG